MLSMCCIYLSDLSEEFMAFRIQRESWRPYPTYAANDSVLNSPLVV